MIKLSECLIKWISKYKFIVCCYVLLKNLESKLKYLSINLLFAVMFYWKI
jgi:hypothetical protein